MVHIAYAFVDRPDYTAGPRTNALRLLPEMSKRGYRVTALIAYTKACPAQQILLENGVEVIAMRWPKYCEDQLELLRDALTTCDPDVYVPNILTSGCFAARYLRESGRPTIAGHRSDDEYNWGMAERFCKMGDEWAVSGLFCVGSKLADQVRTWNPSRTRIAQICSGVPIPSELADPSGPLRLVYAGRMEDKQKRIMLLADCFCRALNQFPNASARLIGDGSKLADVKSLFESQGLGARVEFTGLVSPERVQSKLRWGNVLVLLSDYEGVPGAVMDGMAVGLAPVCLDIEGGLRELVIHRETGLLVQDREGDFDDAIAMLNDSETLRHELSGRARSHIESAFSLAVAADKWERLIEQVMATSGPRKRIRFPRKFELPQPYPKLGSQDNRRPKSPRLSLGQQIKNRIPGRLKQLIRQFAQGDSKEDS